MKGQINYQIGRAEELQKQKTVLDEGWYRVQNIQLVARLFIMYVLTFEVTYILKRRNESQAEDKERRRTTSQYSKRTVSFRFKE